MALDWAGQVGHDRWMETQCARCGEAMSCKPEGGCWCAELPRVPMPAEAKGCLCEKCLRAEIETQRNLVKNKAV